MNKKHLPIMTIAEVAAYLPKVPRASVYKLAQQGRIPCQKVGRHWRFRREALDPSLESAHSLTDADALRTPEGYKRTSNQWP